MSKRKIASFVLSMLAITVLAIGSTLAYFTSNDSETNTFEMGNIAINLKESNDGGETWDEDGLEYNDSMPGDRVDKLAVVEVDENSADCYVRIHMDIVTEGLTNANDIALIENAVKAEAVKYDFIAGANGDYYYNDVAHKDDVLKFIDGFVLPLEISNDSQNGSFSIELTADAIQAANITLGDASIDFFANYPQPQA